MRATGSGSRIGRPGSRPEPQPTPAAQQEQDLHNITYRARVDGVARGALITYKINETQVQSADPTMLPGRIFEAQAGVGRSEAGRNAGVDPVALFGQPALRDPRR